MARGAGAGPGRAQVLTPGCLHWRYGGAAESAGCLGPAGAHPACASAPAAWPAPPRPRTRLRRSGHRSRAPSLCSPAPRGGGPSSPRGVSSIRDFPLRSAPCATSSSTRCTCGPWTRLLSSSGEPLSARPPPPAAPAAHLAPVRRGMQRLPAVLVLGAQAGPVLQQQRRCLAEPVGGGDV